jgi:dTDP-4-dehydrorhamnose 3,5-epimerase-like enzyme
MEDLHQASTGGLSLLFSDELEGTEFRLRSLSLYSADDVKERLETDSPEYGRWLKVETEADGEGFASAPGELIEELQRLEADDGEVFRVTRCQKSGSSESDPYEVNAEKVSEEDQSRL